jgi:hypothetical protein
MSKFRISFSSLFLLSPLASALLLASFAGIPGSAASNDEAEQIKKTISSGLAEPWKLTGFESVDSPPGPWEGLFGSAYVGYSATCENLVELKEDQGGKNGAANNAKRHPIFSLWLFHIRGSLTPAKVQHDLDQLRSSPIQRQIPKLLGSNKHFVVTCVYDCSEPAVESVAAALGLKNAQGNSGDNR